MKLTKDEARILARALDSVDFSHISLKNQDEHNALDAAVEKLKKKLFSKAFDNRRNINSPDSFLDCLRRFINKMNDEMDKDSGATAPPN